MKFQRIGVPFLRAAVSAFAATAAVADDHASHMKDGDKINFMAEKVNGALTITQFAIAK